MAHLRCVGPRACHLRHLTVALTGARRLSERVRVQRQVRPFSATHIFAMTPAGYLANVTVVTEL
jgi:hypothetical protein